MSSSLSAEKTLLSRSHACCASREADMEFIFSKAVKQAVGFSFSSLLVYLTNSSAATLYRANRKKKRHDQET